MSSLISSLGASLLPRFDVLDSKLDSLDVQVPNDLAAKLANLDTAISNIDLSSVPPAVDLSSILSKLDSLDVQVPDDLAAKLANLDTSISNIDWSSVSPAVDLSSILSKLDSLDFQVPDDLAAKLANLYTAISNIDLSSVGSSSVSADSILIVNKNVWFGYDFSTVNNLTIIYCLG